jgi:ketosteroid isomerase-like protein
MRITGAKIMSITINQVEKLFNYLKTGKSEKFFEHVADNVQWTVMGTHPLAGTYKSKEEFISHTFGRLNKILKEGVVLKVNNIIVKGNTAIVEMESLSTTLNGKPFNNTYCWIVEFENNAIVKVRAYVDSALVQKVIDENE